MKKMLRIQPDDFNIVDRKHLDTIFSLSNGYIGSKGNLEENSDNAATFVNGFYETDEIVYGEEAYGYAKKSQSIVGLSGINNYSLALANSESELLTLDEDSQVLKMDRGELERQSVYTSEAKHKFRLTSQKKVSMTEKNVVLYECEIQNEGKELELDLTFFFGKANSSKHRLESFDPRVTTSNEEALTYEIQTDSDNPQQLNFTILTKNSGLALKGYQKKGFSTANATLLNNTIDKEKASETYRLKIASEETISIQLTTVFGDVYPVENSGKQAALPTYNESDISAAHLTYYEDFWKYALIDIEDDQALMTGINFNLFHLNQAAGRDGKSNIPAKGLTGLGYEGHCFWDTEMYMMPYFIFHDPEVAKQLLIYRYNILDKARERARELGVTAGVLFPWRTINGEECSPYYPAGTAQIHINGDIAYALQLYYQATHDKQFMFDYGIEMLVETARFWAAYGNFSITKANQFVINGVTGPDEYTTMENNNYYTNKIAQYNMVNAVYWVRHLNEAGCSNKAYSVLINKLNIGDNELSLWDEIAQKMYFPTHPELELTEQSDAFFDKERWDFEAVPKENYPLLLHYHPMTIYKYQVCKQADVILSHMLFPTQENMRTIKNDFDYYNSITTHDSSLSKSAFSVVASYIGKKEQAYDLFRDTVLMDLEDQQGNVRDGIHAANMGGSLLSVLYGFLGVRLVADRLEIAPNLPTKWQRLKQHLVYRGRVIYLEVDHHETRLTLVEGASVSIVVRGSEFTLKPAEKLIVSHD